MSEDVGPGRPPMASRFRKGQSGNPKGRPRAAKERSASAFDVVIDRTLTVVQNGEAREVTVEEALQHKTYQDAIAGNRAAMREVLRMIARREAHLAAEAPAARPPQIVFESADPDNVNEALVLLGIAERDTGLPHPNPNDPYERLYLQTWAVQAALNRRGHKPFTEQELKEIKSCTRAPGTLRWPRRIMA